MALTDEDYRIICSGTCTSTGDYWEMTFGYRLQGVSEDAFTTAGKLANEFNTIVGPALHPMLPTNVHWANTLAKKVGGSGGPAAVLIADAIGTAPSACETIGNGALISWYGNVDPVRRGRTYFPGIPNDSLDSGVWDAAYRTAADDFINAMLVVLNADTWSGDFEIQSRQIGVFSQIVDHGLLRYTPGTQRLRLRR